MIGVNKKVVKNLSFDVFKGQVERLPFFQKISEQEREKEIMKIYLEAGGNESTGTNKEAGKSDQKGKKTKRSRAKGDNSTRRETEQETTPKG